MTSRTAEKRARLGIRIVDAALKGGAFGLAAVFLYAAMTERLPVIVGLGAAVIIASVLLMFAGVSYSNALKSSKLSFVLNYRND